MKPGFIPALGTPLKADGELERNSFTHQIHDQIAAHASAVLVMGTMGMEAMIRGDQYREVAAAAVAAVAGKVPVLVGAMDNSVARVAEKCRALHGLDLAGIVLTAPYYHPATPDEMYRFFSRSAEIAGFPLYLYDLPGVTGSPIAFTLVKKLIQSGTIAGLKSGNMALIRQINFFLEQQPEYQFYPIYSGLDTMDIAWRSGVRYILDGMFSCTAAASRDMVAAFQDQAWSTAAALLNGIIELRDLFIANGVFAAFTTAMNHLGYPGNFHPDYSVPLSPEQQQTVLAKLKEITS